MKMESTTSGGLPSREGGRDTFIGHAEKERTGKAVGDEHLTTACAEKTGT